MVEERWHDFAKEKPSEDMEGRNFIVSNGHYEKIATWCGYWENEPFMGDRICDEVVRWKFYFTPEEEKANEATRTEPNPMKCDELKEYYYYEDRVITPATHMYRVYHADEVDAAIAELKAEIESLKASHYAESVDAGMRERRLQRALWIARAKIAKAMKAVENLNNYLALHKNSKWFGIYATRIDTWYYKWDNVERKCRAKAEERK